MVTVNAEEEKKENEVLIFDYQVRSFYPRKNYHINCITGYEIEELEVHFLERFLVAILTKDQFLVAIIAELFTPSATTP